jgi:hypothetical protein
VAFFQSLCIVQLLIVMSSNRARNGMKASPPIFKMASGMPSGHTDLFLPVIAYRFLITLILMVKCLAECFGFISGMSRSQMKTEA